MGFWEVIAIMVVVNGVATVFKSRGRHGVESGEIEELRHRLEEQGETIADAQTELADQNLQMEELHERLEFTERVLAQLKDRPEIGPGHQ